MSGRERKEGPDVLSDIEIAQATKPQHISAIAEKAGVPQEYLVMYGTNKAKVDYNLLKESTRPDGKLVLEDPEYCASVSFTVGSWIEMLDKYSAG